MEALERIGSILAAKRFWRDGWIGARQTRIYLGKHLPAESLARLTALEALLRPKDLVDKVRGVVLIDKSGRSIDLHDLEDVDDDDYAAAMERASATIEALGRDVAMDETAFATLLPDLVIGDHKLLAFGRGLALGSDDPAHVWQTIVEQMKQTNNFSVALLAGFLQGLTSINSEKSDSLLDEAVEDAVLAEWFPVIQSLLSIDEKAVARLHRALELGRAPIARFVNLAYGRASDALPGPVFQKLLSAINSRPGGTSVAIGILSMRIHSDRTDKKASVPEVAQIGHELLGAYDFQKDTNGQRTQREDFELSGIVRATLREVSGKQIVRKLCRQLLIATANHSVSAFEYNDLVTSLMKTHPEDALDELVAGDEKARSRSVNLIADISRHRENPMAALSDSTLLAWCEHDPHGRYPFVAATAPLFVGSNADDVSGWRDLARSLLKKAPDKKAVFKEIAARLTPTGGVGSLSSQYETRLQLLSRLDVSDVRELNSAVAEVKQKLRSEADLWRKRETDRDRDESGRFE